MSKITWAISSLDCYPEYSGQSNVVTTAHWRCTGEQDGFTASVYSTCAFTVPEGVDLTPYGELTEGQILSWVWTSGVDKDATEAAVQQQIKNQINPPMVSPPLPWAAPQA